MNIDFYILEKASNQQALLHACQLVAEAYAKKETIYIHTASKAEAERMDTLLWTFQDDSFLPHKLYDPADDFLPSIQIGFDLPPLSPCDLLVNLTRETPAFYSKFNRMIEIVFADPLVQQLARERFRQYRDQGHQLNTHKIEQARETHDHH